MRGRVQPRVVVFSTLFPSEAQPRAGLFIRERMFRVARELPLRVVAPVPWFPLQGWLRRFKPHFRPNAVRDEVQSGIEVARPRFLSVPGWLKGLDGWSLAVSAYPRLRRVKRTFGLDVIDAHFAYPDGFAAGLLGRWLDASVTITLRGTEPRLARHPRRRRQLRAAVRRADHVFAVSRSLADLAVELGAPSEKVQVVGNGVDTQRFAPVPQHEARQALGLPEQGPVLVTVGALVERKGAHRVIEVLPGLLKRYPDLHYLVVGGASPEGDWGDYLARQAEELGVADRVHFLGSMSPDELRVPLSAADLFVLATRNEGWANVFLEAMACGLPVVATDVGGNAEVIGSQEVGRIVPFGDPRALKEALEEALEQDWDRAAIRAYASANGWEERVKSLVERFRSFAPQTATS